MRRLALAAVPVTGERALAIVSMNREPSGVMALMDLRLWKRTALPTSSRPPTKGVAELSTCTI